VTNELERLSQGREAPGAQRLGPYRLLRKLGDGGMSSVWLAERADGQFDGQVAIKLLPPALAGHAGFRERLQREAQIMAKLSHPHIAKLLDAGVGEGGTPYLVLELVQGQSITAYCDERKLDVLGRLRLMLQVCEAVSYLHGNLAIHRDIKPSNIMVDGNGQAKLVDFGIAKLIGDVGELTSAHGGAFTPDYAAPEQIRGEALTTAADVYSLGAVLYRLLAGVKPQSPWATDPASSATISPTRPSRLFARGSTLPAEQQALIAKGRDTSVRHLERQMRDELDGVVLKAMAPELAERYVGASALADDLEAYLKGLPVSAKSPTWRYTARKFAARRRAGVTVSVLAALCILGLSGVSVWQAQRATQEAERTQKVLTFITELLGKSNPNATDGKRITVSDLLKGSLPDVQRQFDADPVAHREVLIAITSTLQAMEDMPEAVELLRAQRAHSLKHFGPDSLEVAKDEVEIGLALFPIGGHVESIEVLKEAIRKLEKLGRVTDEVYLNANVGLAMSAVGIERFDEARRGAAIAERVYPLVQGLTDDQRAWYASSLQFVYSFDVKETARWLEVLAREKPFDKNEASIKRATARCGYASALFEVGQNNEALAEMRQAVAELRRLTGEGSLIDETCSGELGLIELELMLVADARQTLQRSLDQIPTSKFQTRRMLIAQDFGRLGTLALRTLDLESAKRYRRQGQEAVEKEGAARAPALLWLETHLAIVEGQWPQARAALEELRIQAEARSTPGGNSEGLVRRSANVANVMRLEGDAAGAAEMLFKAREQLASILPYQDARVARVEAYLAQALIDLRRHDEAAQQAAAASQKAAQWLAEDHPLTLQSRFIHAQALERLGRRDEAATLLRQTQATFSARFGQPLDERLMRVLY
jgi:serine/threonine protein kinase